MKKTMRTALLLILLAVLCLGLSGCENEDECIRQVLIDLGYMTPTPETSETPEPSETPEDSASPEPSETPEVSASPEPSETPEASETPEPSETPEASETPEVSVSLEPSASTEPDESPGASDAPASVEEPGSLLPTPNLPTPNLPDPAEVLPSLADHLPRLYQDNPSAAPPDIPDAADDATTP